MTQQNDFTGFARDGLIDKIKSMLDSGYDPNTPNVAGALAIELASENGYIDIVKLLIKHGSKVDPNEEKPHSTALIYASTKGNTQLVQLLLENGANPNIIDESYNQTALIWACAYGSPIEVIKLLLEYGANPQIKDVYDNDALTLAKHFKHNAIVAELENL